MSRWRWRPVRRCRLNWRELLATYTVTTTTDLVGVNLLPGSLRWAIGQANSNPGADTIVFNVNGNFNLTAFSNGDDSNAGGDLDVNGSLTIVGNGSANTVFVGNGSDRVLDLRSGSISLSGLTVQGGRSNTGAGIRIDTAATVTMTDVIVQNNVGNGGSKGGGIYSDGSLTMTRSVVRNNGNTSSGDIDGAGIYSDNGATLVLRDVDISGNVADNKEGGGVFVHDNGSATVENVSFVANRAKDGGGMFVKNNATVSIVNSTFSGNIASDQGGGLYAESAVTLDHVSFVGNRADTDDDDKFGGGVYDKDGEVRSQNSLYASNTGGNTNRALVSQGYNLSDDGSSGFNGTGDRKNTAAGVSALADNGGFTRTHAIGIGSAARDAANPVQHAERRPARHRRLRRPRRHRRLRVQPERLRADDQRAVVDRPSTRTRRSRR